MVDIGYGPFRVDHSRDEFARGKAHINATEGIEGYAKVRLVRFRGMHRNTILLPLKETEFHFNLRDQNIGKLILKLRRKIPLS